LFEKLKGSLYGWREERQIVTRSEAGIRRRVLDCQGHCKALEEFKQCINRSRSVFWFMFL